MNEPTPRPWKVAWSSDSKEFVNDIIGPNDLHVVCFGHDYDEYGVIPNPFDAPLIAAAPQLYEALSEITKILKVRSIDGKLIIGRKTVIYLLQLAESALTAARGGV